MGDFCGISENLRRASQTTIVDPLHNSGRRSTIVEAETKGLSEKKGGEEHFEGSWPRGAKILWTVSTICGLLWTIQAHYCGHLHNCGGLFFHSGLFAHERRDIGLTH